MKATDKIVTIEGLSANSSHPVQKAWAAVDVPQCGYCQSGQIMAAAALLKKKPKPTDADIDAAMTNICRCGTYQRIREAVHQAAGNMRRAADRATPPVVRRAAMRKMIFGKRPASLPPQFRRRLRRAAGGGLALGFKVPFVSDAAGAERRATEVNIWVAIKPDDTCVIRIARSEMGQGTLTGLAQLVAEELECDWKKVTTEGITPGAQPRAQARLGRDGHRRQRAASAPRRTTCAAAAPRRA